MSTIPPAAIGMTRTAEIRELFTYNRWAREQLLDAAAALDEDAFTRDMGSSFPSVRDTLVHIMSADWVWLSRWQGSSPTAMPEAWKTFTMAQIREQWSEIDAATMRFVEGLNDDDLERMLSYRLLSGTAMTSTIGEMLRHVVNHATYHRGQVTTLLRQLGARSVSTDLILFYRNRGQPAA